MKRRPKRLKHAGFWIRFAAYLIDQVVLFVIGLYLGFVIQIAIGSELAVFAAAFIITWLYFAGLESSKYQGTLGKMLAGLAVTDLKGRKISFFKASLRWLSKILSGLIFGIGYLMIGFTKRKQGLHDILVGTYVIKKRMI